jgi:hypothetical protein
MKFEFEVRVDRLVYLAYDEADGVGIKIVSDTIQNRPDTHEEMFDAAMLAAASNGLGPPLFYKIRELAIGPVQDIELPDLFGTLRPSVIASRQTDQIYLAGTSEVVLVAEELEEAILDRNVLRADILRKLVDDDQWVAAKILGGKHYAPFGELSALINGSGKTQCTGSEQRFVDARSRELFGPRTLN